MIKIKKIGVKVAFLGVKISKLLKNSISSDLNIQCYL